MLSSASLLCVVVVVLSALVLWLTLQLRRRLRELGQARDHMLRYAWLEWWVRNAAETTPLEPARPILVALAQAAQLAPDLHTFADDCEAIGNNHELPSLLRNTARQFAGELHAPELPWTRWARETGKPMHNAEAQRLAYERALREVVELSLCIPSTRSSPTLDNVRDT